MGPPGAPANPRVERHAAEAYRRRKSSSIQISGRHVLNVWRIMKSRCALNIFSFENVVYHFLHRRVPRFDYDTLTRWSTEGSPILQSRVYQYHLERAELTNKLLDASNVIHQSSEFAKVYGVDFFSVLTRGSQFKVEAMMLRLTKPENFMTLSPGAKKVAQQRAAECLPLVMEPQSNLYTSPLIVLDFQSLYPSIMIAYNYCYSTCLGMMATFDQPKPMGAGEVNLPRGLVGTLARHNLLQVAPNGAMYVKAPVRQSLVARMLTEILDTRVLVKQQMARISQLLIETAKVTATRDRRALLQARVRKLDSFQMALKLVANVTYGYIGASFSGRMPCVDIADSIVQTGRETLERAIAAVNNHPTWNAKVVYGDTDSLFVYLPGATRDQAFDIGEEMAKFISDQNPPPVKLKFEKVYHPCVLLAKKRYVGYKYEHRRQAEPIFEGKGIETVRRDGCPATQKIMEKCLRLLFEHQDLTRIRTYLHREWGKISRGRVSIQDFVFAKEVKLGVYNPNRLPPPGAIVSLKHMAVDPRQEPQYGERVPYVVVYGGPQDRLADQVMSPRELLANPQMRLHGRYYILKQIIPSLNRIFTLIGVDLHHWFNEMPKNICPACANQPQATILTLTLKVQRMERRHQFLNQCCSQCTSVPDFLLRAPVGHPLICSSLDCPIYYEQIKSQAELTTRPLYWNCAHDIEQEWQEL
ncbi:hypothetical protein BJ085DRAFT_43731 [Dimargaris cristalligena]|uniref:DNA polymerase n=1 Tax=Dimargaris cristalligena TaxID=215637 RepID=A0A4P9ZTA4_9FUNG|nr:hypothetical protein BJ085DRAFT_43731 [Dimargaris cristalligena]|eukprot:RKP36804.1 hypothetical protein BJ085DRAFT_43731 [Dimargaris cristalligena]